MGNSLHRVVLTALCTSGMLLALIISSPIAGTHASPGAWRGLPMGYILLLVEILAIVQYRSGRLQRGSPCIRGVSSIASLLRDGLPDTARALRQLALMALYTCGMRSMASM